MATIIYEGLPIRPDAASGGSLVEKYKVTSMFTAPTAMRVLKKQDPKYLRAARPVEPARAVPRRRAARRADREVDRRGARQADHRQLLADRERLADPDRRQRRRAGAEQVRQPGRADVRLRRASSSTRPPARTSSSRTRRASSSIEGPTPPGFMQTVWRDDERFVETYWKSIPGASSTRPSTGASATRTATTSSSAAPTTSSTSPATGWARARSRRASRAIRTSPRSRSSASPTR